MPFTPITSTVKVEINGHDTVSQQKVANVMHVGQVTPTDATIAFLTDIANVFVTAITANLALWSASMEFDTVVVTDLNTADGNQVTVPFSAGTVGTGGTDSWPGVAALLKLISSERSRSGRGRVYIGPIGASSATDGNGSVSTGYKTAVSTWFAALQAGLNALSVPCAVVVASRKLGVNYPIINAFCEATAAYQRRRGMR
jgi:hypothetical protein